MEGYTSSTTNISATGYPEDWVEYAQPWPFEKFISYNYGRSLLFDGLPSTFIYDNDTWGNSMTWIDLQAYALE